LNKLFAILRPSLAWFLLLTVCFQQLAGRIYVGRVYSVEIEARMNKQEQAAATMLKAKTGLDIHVKILGEDQPRFVYRTGYSAPVIFSKEIDGETYCFVLGHEPIKFVHYTYVVNTQEAAQGIPNSESLLVKLFSDYYFATASLRCTAPPRDYYTSAFSTLDMTLKGDPSVPYPPPRRV